MRLFFLQRAQQSQTLQPPAPPPADESVFVAWSEEPTNGHEDNLVDANEGAEDFSGGAEDESDDLTEVVKTPEVEPQVKE